MVKSPYYSQESWRTPRSLNASLNPRHLTIPAHNRKLNKFVFNLRKSHPDNPIFSSEFQRHHGVAAFLIVPNLKRSQTATRLPETEANEDVSALPTELRRFCAESTCCLVKHVFKTRYGKVSPEMTRGFTILPRCFCFVYNFISPKGEKAH